MFRELADPIPELRLPQGIDVRLWRMETEEEQRRYLEAYDAAFENESKPLGQLQHFMKADIWAQGTTVTAFAGDEVVGSVMVYYNPNVGQNPRRTAATEYVFVRPGWRRQGIAQYLIAEALQLLRARGMKAASLEVASWNTGARSLYERLGYQVRREEISLGRWLSEPLRT
jgi:ribosomal protein S18 acetylase RimI-like enzyme